MKEYRDENSHRFLKKNKVNEFALSDNKICYRNIEFKKVWYWQRY